MILVILMLAVGTGIYALTLASLAWQDLLFGAALTGVLLLAFRRVALPRPLPSSGRVLKALVYFPIFVFYVNWDIVVGTWQVAMIVCGFRKLEHPGIIRVPLGDRSPTATGIAGLVITLSPGTFLVDVDWERREMLIHAIDASDPDGLREAYDRFYRNVARHVVP